MMRKCLIVMIFLAALLMPLEVFAKYDYIVNSYNVNIVVHSNNTFDITENIGVYFNVPRHGIFRELPLRNEIVRLDGTKSKNRVVISNIEANEQYTTYNESGNKVIKIGDPNRKLRGAKNYSVRYKYNIGKDTGKGYDEFYFNLIGEWDTTITNISFTINMPDSFDKDKLGFSYREKGSTESRDVSYVVNGNTIIGNYEGTLNPNESLTVRLELPEGYFVNTSSNFDFMMLAALILPVIFVLYCFFVWKKYGKNGEVIETVEFYPPKGFNSAEVGFLYKGSVEDKDAVSLLIYLANEGYLKIAETDKKSLLSKTTKGFKIIKVKDYDGNNENEKIFLKGLFGKAPTLTFAKIEEAVKNNSLQGISNSGESLPEVSDTDLHNKFYTTLAAIKANLSSEENKAKIFEKSPTGKIFLGIVMAVVIFVLITAKPILETQDATMLVFALLFPGIGFSVLITTLVNIRKIPGVVIFFLIIWGLGFGAVPWCFMVLPALLTEPIYWLTYLVGVACIVGIIVFLKLIPKRTPYGNEMLGKIRGFKNFLETAEKGRLEELVADEPEYFYNILPYTYVLGVSDKWIKKFESIALQAPDWYSGTGTFNKAAFSSFMNSTMTSASKAMTSSPSSGSSGSSGGRSSGGGFSGGGSGGGRGGSW